MAGKKISFPPTKFDKEFAKLWLGVIGVTFLFGLVAEGFSILGLIICALMFGAGLFYFNKTVWALADEVWDCGDHLKVVKSGKHQLVRFNEIKEIDLTYPNHKHLITIKAEVSGSIGSNFTFRAVSGYPVFRSPEVLSQLKQRVKNA